MLREIACRVEGQDEIIVNALPTCGVPTLRTRDDRVAVRRVAESIGRDRIAFKERAGRPQVFGDPLSRHAFAVKERKEIRSGPWC
jgi:hypothetical protein